MSVSFYFSIWESDGHTQEVARGLCSKRSFWCVFLEEDLQTSQSFLPRGCSLFCLSLAELISSSEEEIVPFLHPTVSLHCSVWETSGTNGVLYPALQQYTDFITSH